ncbi:SapC family protein [Caulobacter soli]|uniref:SapC family protein n=1 Tax=Caulobacter soli TaxID=2708539 RepID=UPI0013E9D9A4|nr:SapC family protein [Caulobacter soli]
MASKPRAASTPPLPLFYRDPLPLSASVHAAWRLKEGDAAFAQDAAYAPLVLGELAAASASYPVVFAGEQAAPVAILGLEQRNLFVADGQWAPFVHVPAYVRRYPFGFIATRDPDDFVLAIDAGSDRVVQAGEEGEPLFEDGKPSALTLRALAFCDAFKSEAAATAAFSQALLDKGLLIERRADATLPDGRKLGLEGFQIVDYEAFQALDSDTLVDWHAKGWLALINFHLASLDRFRVLLDREGAAAVEGGAT